MKRIKYLERNTMYNLLIGLIVSILLFNSCSTLQKQIGYENYTKNTDWKTRKL